MSILQAFFSKRSLENPNTSLSDPDDWAWEALGSKRSTSGVRVNRKTVLKYSPVWKAVNLISGSVAKLPYMVFKNTTGGKERAPEHPAFPLVRRKANSEMTAFTIRQVMQGHALLLGNGYAFIDRDGAARPTQLLLLNPETSFPVRVNQRLWYVIQINGEQRKIVPENILHIKGLGYDGLMGYPVIQFARDSLGAGIGASAYGARYFLNNARPSMVLEHPGVMKPEAIAKLREQWNAMHAGIDNAHKTAILEEGMKANPFSINAKDSQLLESKEFSIRDAANWFSIPPHKIGDTTRTSFKSLEQENQAFLDEGLDPWLVTWEAECWDKLLTEDEKRRETHFFEFIRAAIVRVDLKTRNEAYSKALAGMPYMLVNEVRRAENLNDLPDGQGDQLLIPANIGGGDAASQNNDSNQDGQTEENAKALQVVQRKIITDSVRRMVTRLGIKAERADKKGKLGDWVKGFMAEDRDTIDDVLRPGMNAALMVGGLEPRALVDTIIEYFFNRIGTDLLIKDRALALTELERNLPNQIADMVLKGE